MSDSILMDDDLIRYIKAAGEHDHIDAKGPMQWDGAAASARLAKSIAAFANSKDGGVLVIGKAEEEPGVFKPTGLTDEQANSFDQTKMGTWINNYFAPPVSLQCHRVEHDGKTFVVITVAEFDDIPALCIKGYNDPDNAKKTILRENQVYVRNSSAESRPISSVDELRTLIGLATQKRGHELLKYIDRAMSGRPLAISTSVDTTDEEQFDNERQRIEESLGATYAEQMAAGAWRLVVHPITYVEKRWDDDELEGIVRERSVRLLDEFPPTRNGTHHREWGIGNDYYGETWTLARSGQFLVMQPYAENTTEYVPPWVSSEPEPKRGPGQWLEFKLNMKMIAEMVMFAVRLAAAYGEGEGARLHLQATSLAGRKLLTTDFSVNIRERDEEECRAETFDFIETLTPEVIAGDWESVCAEAMRRFANYFPGRGKVSAETMAHWVERFKSRQF